MANTRSAFGRAFEAALEEFRHQETPEMPPDYKADLIRESLEFTRRHDRTIDLAIEGLSRLAEAPTNAQQLLDLGESMKPRRGEVDMNPALAILGGEELAPAVADAEESGIVALSLGLSGGWDVFAGFALGADCLLQLENNHAFLHAFGAIDVGFDTFRAAGLNFGIWGQMPADVRFKAIGGFLFDFSENIPASVRYMTVKQGPGFFASPSKFDFLGSMISLNWGSGLGAMAYRGVQFLLGIPSKRIKLTVSNCTDGTDPCEPGNNSIAQNVSSVLTLSVENSSGDIIEIAKNDTMIFQMPSFITADVVNGLESISLPSGWTGGFESGTTILKATQDNDDPLKWQPSTTLVTTLNGVTVEASGPSSGGIDVEIPDAVVENATIAKNGAAATALLHLVAEIDYAEISAWTCEDPDFDDENPSGQNVKIHTLANKIKVGELADITDSKGNSWTVGYQFYIDEYNNPSLRAVLWETGTAQTPGVTFFAEQFQTVTTSGITSYAYYKNNEDNPNYLKITVALIDS